MNLPAQPGTHPKCREIGDVMGMVGDRWTMPVVGVLAAGPRRFNDIRRTVGGISQQMLTRTLRALERDGMVTRTVHPTVPPQVEYALSPLGQSLADRMHSLGAWAGEHLEAIADHRARFDRAG
jgi:DNA-binding HxlR family transcriptional regulator